MTELERIDTEIERNAIEVIESGNLMALMGLADLLMERELMKGEMSD